MLQLSNGTWFHHVPFYIMTEFFFSKFERNSSFPMGEKMKELFVVSLLTTILISSCGGVTPVPATSSIPEAIITHPDLEVITPENIRNLEEIAKWGEGIVYDVAFSPDKQTIAVRTIEGVYFYDSNDLEEKRFLKDELPHINNLSSSIAFSPDGKYLAISIVSFVRLFNLTTNKYEKFIYSPIPNASVSDVGISQDNRYAVVTTNASVNNCDGAGGNFGLYDLSDKYGGLVFDRYFCYPSYSRYRFTKNNRAYFFLWYSTSPVPHQMDVVDLTTGGMIESVPFDFKNIDPIKTFYDVSPDGKVFAAVDPNEGNYVTRFVDVETGDVVDSTKGYINFKESLDGSLEWDEMFTRPQNQITENCKINSGNFDGHEEVVVDGNFVTLIYLNASRFQSMEIWNWRTCQLMKQISFMPNTQSVFITNGKFSSDGSLFAKASGYNINVWDVKIGEIRFVAQSPVFRFPLNVFAFNGNGTRLVASTRKSNIYPEDPYKAYSLSVWDTQTGKLLSTIETGGEYLSDIITSSNNDILAVTDATAVHFWDIQSIKELTSVPFGQPVFTQNGDAAWILRSGQEDTLSLYDVYTGKLLRAIQVAKGVREFCVNEDQSKFALITRNQSENQEYLIGMNSKTGAEIYTAPLGKDVNYLETRGDYFVTYSSEGLIDIWDFDNQSPMQSINGYYTIDTIRNFLEQPFSPWNPIDEIVFSSKSQIIISLGLDNHMRIWDIQNGKLLGEINPKFEMSEIDISPDGRLLAVSGTDGYVYIWGIKKPK